MSSFNLYFSYCMSLGEAVIYAGPGGLFLWGVSLCRFNIFVARAVFFLIFLLFCLFAFSRAAPMAYGGSQARGLIGAAAASLHQSHSNSGSEPRLQPTPQVTATPDP